MKQNIIKKNNEKVNRKKMIPFMLNIFVLFIISMIFLNCNKLYAISNIISVKNVEVMSKSDSTIINNIDYKDNTIINDIVFQKVGDSITYRILLKNNDEKNYVINLISDNNTNKYLTYEYSKEKIYLNSKSESEIIISIKYSNELFNVLEKNQMLSCDFFLNLIDENEKEHKEELVITNDKNQTIKKKKSESDIFFNSLPKTGDNSRMLLIIFAIAFLNLIILIILNKYNKYKKFYFLVLFMIIISGFPIIANANNNIIEFKFANTIKLNDKLIINYEKDGKVIQSVIKNGELLKEPEAPYKPGYIFKGWYLENGEEFNFSKPIFTDININAKFEKEIYKITYELNEGINDSDNPTEYTVEDSIILKEATKEGYTFEGWYENEKFTGDKIEQIGPNKTGNVKLYAKWKETNQIGTYKVEYYLEDIEKDENNNKKYSLNKIEEKEEQIGKIVVAPIKEIKGFTYDEANTNNIIAGEVNEEILVLKVYYNRNEYILELLKDDKIDNVEGAGKYKYGAEVNITAKLKEKAGYKYFFKKWETNNFELFAENSNKEVKFIMPSENLRLKATGEKELIKYIITYELNEGINDIDNPTEYTVEDSIRLKEATKEGYTFEGWYENEELTGDKIEQIGPNKTENVKLYAKWNKIYLQDNLVRISRDDSWVTLKAGGDENEQWNDENVCPWNIGAACPSPVDFNGKIFFYFRGEYLDKNDSNVYDAKTKPFVYVLDKRKIDNTEIDNTEKIINWNSATYIDIKNIKENENLENEYITNIMELGIQCYGAEASNGNWTYNGKDDSDNIWNISACVYNGKVYLYYRGEYIDENNIKHRPLMYATSEDGINFTKKGRVKNNGNDIGDSTPAVYSIKFKDKENEIIFRTNNIHYLSNQNIIDGDCYLTYSEDGGKTWGDERKVISHTEQDWCKGFTDQIRLYADDEYLYIFFDAHYRYGYDYPEGVGVARVKLNTDNFDPDYLLNKDNWEMYPYNPIMIRGASNSPDEAAIWTFTPMKIGNVLYAFYEGCGPNLTMNKSTVSNGREPYFSFYPSNSSYLEQGSNHSLLLRRMKKYWSYRIASCSHIKACILDERYLKMPWNNKIEDEIEEIKLCNVGLDGNEEKYLSKDVNGEIIISKQGDEFQLSFENSFFKIKDKEGYYISPKMMVNDKKDNYKLEEYVEYIYPNSNNETYMSYFYKADKTENIVAKYKSEDLYGNDFKWSLNNNEDVKVEYSSLMGLDWELYPVEKNGNTYFKIQNRWTGCFMCIEEKDGKIIVSQSQEDNNDSILWKIETVKN